MFGMMLFLLALIAPLVAFSLYVQLRKGWPFKKLIPYHTAHGVVIGLVLGFGLRLEGVYLIVAGGIGGLLALMSSLSWARGLTVMLGENERRRGGKET